MGLLGALVLLLFFSGYVYIGVAFWRVHKDSFLRLSLYDLTQQSGLIQNFGDHSCDRLRALNSVALDALSFPRLLRLFLGWPLYSWKFRQALNFATYTSRLLGDERTENLKQELLDQGFPQADRHDLKNKEHFQEGFLIRRLDEDLVSVFWHTPQEDAPVSQWPGRVLPFRVPTHIRLQRLQGYLSRRRGTPYWAQGQADSRLPYVVIYEPYSFGRPFQFKDAWQTLQTDLLSLRERLFGPRPPASLFDPDGDSAPHPLAEKAFVRFLKSTQRNAHQRTEEPQN